MTSPSFGEKVDRDASLHDLMENSQRLISTDAQLVLRDRYEIAYDVYGHDRPGAESPYALVLKHWCEDTVTHGELYERMNQFVTAEIGKFFNISFPEFIECPSYVVSMMLDVANRQLKKEQPQIDEALKAMQDAAKAKS